MKHWIKTRISYHNLFTSIDLENEVANLTMEISKAKQDEFEAQEELLEMRRELEDANQQIETLKVDIWLFLSQFVFRILKRKYITYNYGK